MLKQRKKYRDEEVIRTLEDNYTMIEHDKTIYLKILRGLLEVQTGNRVKLTTQSGYIVGTVSEVSGDSVLLFVVDVFKKYSNTITETLGDFSLKLQDIIGAPCDLSGMSLVDVDLVRQITEGGNSNV